MTRESKLNLGFLIAFLALSLPGAAMLFVKKLDPNERMMYMPNAVRRAEAYNNPLPAANANFRVHPPLTMAFVDEASRQLTGRPALRYERAGQRIEPVVSDGRRFELLGYDGASVDVLIWADDAPGLTGSATFGQDETPRPAAGVEVRTHAVPAEVVEELKKAGHTKPPQTVTLARLRFDAAVIGPPARVDLAWTGYGGRRVEDGLTPEAALLVTSADDKAVPPAPVATALP